MGSIYNKLLYYFKYAFFRFGIILLTFVSCSEDGLFNYIFKPDKIEVTNNNLPEIKRILVYDDLSIKLIPDTFNSIKIEANKLLHKNIEYEINNDSLILRNNNPYNWTSYNDSVLIEIHVTKFLNRIEVHGTGLVYCIDTLNFNAITLYAFDGAGEFNLKLNNIRTSIVSHSYSTTGFVLSGRSDLLNTHTHGKGIVDCRNFCCNIVKINHEGINDYHIFVRDTLYVAIYNVGNVYYSGNPDVRNVERIGEGMLIQIE